MPRKKEIVLPDYTAEVLDALTEHFAALGERFPDAVQAIPSVDWPTARVGRAALPEVAQFVRDAAAMRFTFLTDVTGVDWLGRPIAQQLAARFEVVYHLFSLPFNRRLRLKVAVPEDDPHVASVVPLWPTANWHEREVFDMYGIIFDGHPNLSKILTPDFLAGHPLRKDFPLGGEEIWDAEGGSITQPPGSYRPVDEKAVKRFR